ncbi:BTB/POZ domain-containing protein 6-B-like [Topomyia yanbarensis]|uniref:BTB/POZ domain-containing protein 6-B-like n=1 Tax=Topomyia yanbarensis TaxID=2498891 RepID=UPI00273C5B01|nr:BTB/POZ domain-containing protein 6-B-like [Topomyia yanbarensis]
MDLQQDWQVNKNLKSRMMHLLETGTWMDCHFMVGPETNCKMIGAHKFILCMASPVFQAMLRGDLAGNDETIHVPDVEPEIFELLLKYIYTDEISVGSVDESIKLFYAADKYMFPIATDHCLAYLQSAINPQNVCRIYEFAMLHSQLNFVNKCMHYIMNNAKDVLNDESFMEVDLTTIIEILDFEYLNIDNELDCYRALSKYALKHQLCLSKDFAAGNSKNEGQESKTNGQLTEAEVVPASNRNLPTIRDALLRIRFLTLTPEQLAPELAKMDLLTQTEAFSILMNVITPDNGYPMPEGFCTERQRRKRILTIKKAT